MTSATSFEALNKRLHAMAAANRERDQAEPSQKAVYLGPSSYGGELPALEPKLHSVNEMEDPLQASIREYLSTPVDVGEIKEEYLSLVPISRNMRPESYDFPDDKLIGVPGISFCRASDSEIVELGRAVLPMVVSGFSRQGAASIFILAYHLKRPEAEYQEEYVFEGIDRLETLADKKYSEFSNRIMSICGAIDVIIPTENTAKEAAVYSFIAASLLRVFTKSPANYVKAWNHIIDGFSRLYGDAIDVRLPVPNEQAVKSLSDWFSIEPRAKIALYRILYISNSSDAYGGLKSFLFDIHLSNTGMHIVNIFVQLCKFTGASTGVILTLINESETEAQVKCLVAVLKLMQSTAANHQKRMWKYGRIFDETFLTSIQTRSCPKLVYILAAALKMEAPKTHAGILNIVQLADVSKENQIRCEAAAKQLIRSIKAHQSRRGKKGVYDVFKH